MLQDFQIELNQVFVQLLGIVAEILNNDTLQFTIAHIEWNTDAHGTFIPIDGLTWSAHGAFQYLQYVYVVLKRFDVSGTPAKTVVV